MLRLTTTIFVVVLSLTVNRLDAQNLLDDGNLDLASSGGQTSNSDWTLNVNFPDGNDDAAQFQTGFGNAQNTGVGGNQPPGTGTGVWFKSFEGNQNPGDDAARALLFQTVAAPVSGTYLLEFVAARETNFTARDFFVSLSSDGTGGSATVDLNAASIPDGNLGGAARGNAVPFSILLSGVTQGNNLTVIAQMVDGVDALANPQSAFVDSFSLTVVPEPSSSLLVTWSVLGLVAKRRRL